MEKEIPEGFEIKIVENESVQKGTALLLVHPDDFKRVEEQYKAEKCLYCGKPKTECDCSKYGI